ncbi:hypothetical protein ABIA94_006285 [Bradyrhizobium sp. LA7.1]
MARNERASAVLAEPLPSHDTLCGPSRTAAAGSEHLAAREAAADRRGISGLKRLAADFACLGDLPPQRRRASCRVAALGAVALELGSAARTPAGGRAEARISPLPRPRRRKAATASATNEVERFCHRRSAPDARCENKCPDRQRDARSRVSRHAIAASKRPERALALVAARKPRSTALISRDASAVSGL